MYFVILLHVIQPIKRIFSKQPKYFYDFLFCNRGVGTELIVEKTNNVRKAAGMRDIRTAIEPFRPIVDGEEFTEQPLSMLQNGDWNTNVDIIIGTNREEMWNVKTLFKGIPVFKSVLLVSKEFV